MSRHRVRRLPRRSTAEAHGLVADDIIEVQEGARAALESFLARVRPRVDELPEGDGEGPVESKPSGRAAIHPVSDDGVSY